MPLFLTKIVQIQMAFLIRYVAGKGSDTSGTIPFLKMKNSIAIGTYKNKQGIKNEQGDTVNVRACRSRAHDCSLSLLQSV